MVLVKWLKEALEARIKQCNGKTPVKVETARSGQLNDACEQQAISNLNVIRTLLIEYEKAQGWTPYLEIKTKLENIPASNYQELSKKVHDRLKSIIDELTEKMNNGNVKNIIHRRTSRVDEIVYRLKLDKVNVDIFVDVPFTYKNIEGSDITDIKINDVGLITTIVDEYTSRLKKDTKLVDAITSTEVKLPTDSDVRISHFNRVKSMLSIERNRSLDSFIEAVGYVEGISISELHHNYNVILTKVIATIRDFMRKNVRIVKVERNGIREYRIAAVMECAKVEIFDELITDRLPKIVINGTALIDMAKALGEIDVNEGGSKLDQNKVSSQNIGYQESWTIPNHEIQKPTTLHNPPSVGEILQEYMGDQSINSLAKSLQTTPTRLKRILNDNALIDMEFAKKLAKHYRTTSQFWMGINNDYQMWLLKNYDEEQEGLETNADE